MVSRMSRGISKPCTCCKLPLKMSRLYSKVKPPEGGKGTMKAIGWICWARNNTIIDGE